jgi:hypothetical protein
MIRAGLVWTAAQRLHVRAADAAQATTRSPHEAGQVLVHGNELNAPAPGPEGYLSAMLRLIRKRAPGLSWYAVLHGEPRIANAIGDQSDDCPPRQTNTKRVWARS